MDSERFRDKFDAREIVASTLLGVAASSQSRGRLSAAETLRSVAQHLRQKNSDDYSSVISKYSSRDLDLI